jgi:hypothetical protein
VTAPPAGRGPLRQGGWRTPRVCTLPKATRAPPSGRGGAGPPASSGRGRQAERRRSTWAAPALLQAREVEESGPRERPPEAEGGRITPRTQRGGKAHDRGKDVTAGRRPPRPHLPDTVGPADQQPTSLRGRANTAACVPAGSAWHRGSEDNRRTGGGNTARPRLYGGCRATGIPTVEMLQKAKTLYQQRGKLL